MVHDAVQEHARTPFSEPVWRHLAEGFRFVQGTFDDDGAFDTLTQTLSRPGPGTAAPVATTRSTSPSRRARSRWSASSSPGRGWPSPHAGRMAPGGDREAVRARPGERPGTEHGGQLRLPAGVGVPHRPLPRQGDGAEPAGAAVRQPAVRADLERATTSTTCRSPWPRTSASAAGPATTTASARPATSSRTTCCNCSR